MSNPTKATLQQDIFASCFRVIATYHSPQTDASIDSAALKASAALGWPAPDIVGTEETGFKLLWIMLPGVNLAAWREKAQFIVTTMQAAGIQIDADKTFDVAKFGSACTWNLSQLTKHDPASLPVRTIASVGGSQPQAEASSAPTAAKPASMGRKVAGKVAKGPPPKSRRSNQAPAHVARGVGADFATNGDVDEAVEPFAHQRVKAGLSALGARYGIDVADLELPVDAEPDPTLVDEPTPAEAEINLNQQSPVGRDHAEAEAFLRWLDPEGQDQFTFQTFNDVKAADGKARKDGSLVRVLHGALDENWKELRALSIQGAGVYVTVNKTDLLGRETGNVVDVRAQYVDLDGAPLSNLDSLGLLPQRILITNIRGKDAKKQEDRFHAYYKVRGVSLGEFTAIQKRLISLVGSDKSIHDLPRVMRIPGFPNNKYEPFLVRNVPSTQSIPASYSKEEFLAALAIAEAQQGT